MTQPEALRYADQLLDLSKKFKTPSPEKGVCNGVIQELRRLHEVNERLTRSNQELLEALRLTINELKYVLDAINDDIVPFDGDDFHEALRLGQQAIQKGQGNV